MSLFPLDRLLRRLINHGRLTVVDTDGTRATFGPAGGQPTATMRLHDASFKRRILRNPGLVIGEGYMDGSYTVEDGTLVEFLEIVVVSADGQDLRGLQGVIFKWMNERASNSAARASKNVRHHYDIDHALYATFLDADMQYSCGYWRDGVTSLEQAQLDKKRHIAKKLLLEPGMRVLDIGSGWGGLGLHLAREHGVNVTGVTLSTDQHETSVRRAREEGLSDRAVFKLQDYRDETEPYDRIVSVGMFEHVGLANYREFFDQLSRLLKPDGVALLHTIGRLAPAEPVNPWMQKYIFPGTYVPSLSQLAPHLERLRFRLADLELWQTHYAKTLRAWHERFDDHRAEIGKRFDERFLRMWDFYLQVGETSFRSTNLVVFQLQLAKRIGIVPITRDYLYREPN